MWRRGGRYRRKTRGGYGCAGGNAAVSQGQHDDMHLRTYLAAVSNAVMVHMGRYENTGSDVSPGDKGAKQRGQPVVWPLRRDCKRYFRKAS
jgi:hypothetical protein